MNIRNDASSLIFIAIVAGRPMNEEVMILPEFSLHFNLLLV